jgi:hypothetical protein
MSNVVWTSSRCSLTVPMRYLHVPGMAIGGRAAHTEPVLRLIETECFVGAEMESGTLEVVVVN